MTCQTCSRSRIPATAWALVHPARSCLILRHHRPIVLALAMRECADQAIAPNIAARQRHADGFAGGKRQIGAVQSQHRSLTGRLVASYRADLAADLPGLGC